MKILAVIPARKGSKGIPRKNIRIMVDKPLIAYSIENAINSLYEIDVVVSTDSEEIGRISSSYGAKVISRPIELSTDQVTLDPVIYHAVNEMERGSGIKYDIVITMQPTSPLLKVESLDNAINFFIQNDFDTVLSGINRPHLSWVEKNGKLVPGYEKRLNRQQLPKNLLETGAFFISKREFVKEDGRFGPNVSVYEVSEKESIDIDTPQDWWVAEKELSKKNILIRVDGYATIGLGHIYRALVLAYNMIDHNVKFAISRKSDLGIIKLKESNFKYYVIEEDTEVIDCIKDFDCDILINDILDTTEEYMKECKLTGVKIINFEDLGAGAIYADAVINDLYEKKNNFDNHYWGSDYYCIRDEFLLAKPISFNEKVREVLVLFGGTDPLNLTKRLLNVVSKIDNGYVHFTFIVGMGYEYLEELFRIAESMKLNVDFIKDVKLMTEYMGKADMAISSQGRTMLELATMGVPTILLAQNEREQHHEFGYLKNGFINLGLGSKVEDETIKQTIIWLMNSSSVRKQMNEQMKNVDIKKGIERVKKIILA